MEVTLEKPATGTIRASFNYIIDTGIPPVRYIDWPEMAHKEISPQYRQHEVAIRNGRPIRDTFRLDTHGFVFTDHHTKVKDFTDEAERRLKKRWAIIQVWRPIRGKVLIDPLGICDGRTIPQKGFILVQRRYKYRTGEVYHIAYNPEHVWYYFPEMVRDEAMVFKVFDTDQRVDTRFTAHSSFDDPNTPPNAPPRESIETRTFAFWD